jgi:hypothetical protein
MILKNGQNEDHPRALLATLRRVVLGIGGLIFLFGDRALREFWHPSFSSSLMIWACALGIVVICLVGLSGLEDL